MMQMEPDYEAALGLIKHLSSDELKALVNDNEKLTELLLDLPQMKNIDNEKQMLNESTKSLAEHNLTYQPKLEVGKRELIRLYEEVNAVNEDIKDLNTQIGSSASKQPADTIQALMQAAASEKEEEAETLIDKFMAKEESIEDFLTEFVGQKSTQHQRKVKADKIAEIRRKGTVQSSYPQTPSYGTPYPMQPPNMPMPNY